MQKTATREREQLDERLEEVAVATRQGGVVDAEVEDVAPAGDGHLEVAFRLPTGTTEREHMPVPEQATEEFKFVRVCRQAGATIDTHREALVGETIPVVKTDEGWRVDAPPEQSIGGRAIDGLLGRAGRLTGSNVGAFEFFMFTVAFPLLLLFAVGVFLTSTEFNDEIEDAMTTACALSVGALVWSLPVAAAILTL